MALAFYSFLGVAIFLLVGILIYNFVGGKEQMEENSEEEEEEGEEEKVDPIQWFEDTSENIQ